MRTPEPGPSLTPPIGEVFPPALPLDPMPSAPEVLAATGGDVWSWLLAAVLLVTVGGWAVWASRSIEGES